jgi:hypothetical protein
MKLRTVRWCCLLGGCLLGAGCLHTSCPTEHHDPVLPVVLRGTVSVAVSPVDFPPEPRPAPAPQYFGLSACECQCLAAKSSGLANLLTGEARSQSERQGPPSHGHMPSEKRAELFAAVLNYAADDVRNRSAGTALEAYYRLVEAEGKDDLLRASLKELDGLVGQVEDLVAKGLWPANDKETPPRLRSESRADQVKLRLQIAQLNEALAFLIGLKSGGDHCHIWPTERLCVRPAKVDEEACVATALTYRADLNLLRALLAGLNARTLPVARQVLGGVSPLLSGAATPRGPGAALLLAVLACLAGDEVDAVRRQVEDLLAERERQVVREVRDAVRQVNAQAELIGFALERDGLARGKARATQERERKGLPVGADLPKARLDANKAAGDLLHEVVDYNLALARLRQTEGLLWLECLSGHGPPPVPGPVHPGRPAHVHGAPPPGPSAP